MRSRLQDKSPFDRSHFDSPKIAPAHFALRSRRGKRKSKG
ncbi:hypothetical protein NK6_4762 [Bradyrhizobium diazoefficiens]|uniref:Uncharacterized protein n=1 Tax=Bradyrhizobium diazoefficiens TaxID=1355477 RepID=A0A0E4FW52_9BRAD|nr:hypothetical protein NK6_4762 [Bradyrhizobium diazoefficiens]